MLTIISGVSVTSVEIVAVKTILYLGSKVNLASVILLPDLREIQYEICTTCCSADFVFSENRRMEGCIFFVGVNKNTYRRILCNRMSMIFWKLKRLVNSLLLRHELNHLSNYFLYLSHCIAFSVDVTCYCNANILGLEYGWRRIIPLCFACTDSVFYCFPDRGIFVV
jgi:hypothetical protein